MSETKAYLLILHPVSTFFFGGEGSFGSGPNENYIVHSRHLPQQTTLLGMLRMLVLDVHRLLSNAEKGEKIIPEAHKYIGEKSFSIDKPGQECEKDYGHIQKLSQVFILRGEDEFFHKAPKDWGFSYAPETHKAKIAGMNGYNKDFLPVLDRYEPKKNKLMEGYLSNKGHFLKTDEIFVEHNKIGITKKIDKEEDEQAFFKQISFSLKKEFSFGLLIWIDKDTAEKITKRFENDTSLIYMGGERSCFSASLTDEFDIKDDDTYSFPNYTADYANAAPGKSRIVLLSDAYINSKIYNACEFCISNSMEFRHLTSHTKTTTSYYARGETTGSLGRSGKYHLLEQGSVLLFGKDEDLEFVAAELEKASGFRQIGYNIFQKIKTEQTIINT